MQKISIVTPSYNQGAFIAEAIESVLLQNDPCFEHIVVDGGSTDNTVEVLKSYPHLKWISEPDKGQADAVNKGFRMATGDIFGEINADDYYLPGAFAAVRREMDRDDGFKVVTGGQVNIRNGTEADVVSPAKASFNELIRYPENPVGHPSTFYSRSIWEAINGMDASIKYAPDVELFIRMSKISEFKCIPEKLAVNRIHEAGIQGRECVRNWLASLYHIARNGSFYNFEDMCKLTFSWMRQDADVSSDIDWHREYVKAKLSSLQKNGQRVVLAGGGHFACWLLDIAAELPKLKIVAVMDDNPSAEAGRFNATVLPFGALAKDKFDCIVLATDSVPEKLKARLEPHYENSVFIFDIYEGTAGIKPVQKKFRNIMKTEAGQ